MLHAVRREREKYRETEGKIGRVRESERDVEMKRERERVKE